MSAAAAQQFCLRWNNHQPNFVSVFSSLLSNQALTDVTLAAEGQHLEAHRVVLSACSTYFQSLFTTNKSHLHPIVILKDVQFRDLRTMVDFMYSGEVHVSQEQLPSILKTAETLKIKGLAEVQDLTNMDKSQEKQLSTESRLSCEAMGVSVESGAWGSERRSPSPVSPSAAQRRKRMRKASTGSTSESTVTERTSEELPPDASFTHSPPRLEQQSSSQMTMSAEVSERSGSLREQTSTDSDMHNCSQDSGEQPPLMVPEGVNVEVQHGTVVAPSTRSVEEVAGSSASSPQEPAPHHLQHHYPSTLPPAPGDDQSVKARRGRLLIRQPRIKKETDPLNTSPDSDPGSPQLSQQFLQVPTMRIERQSSEPLPSTSVSASKSLLQVPSPSFLQKQHSHPLLPSQQTKPSPGFPVKSHMLSRQSTLHEDLTDPANTMVEQLPVLRIIPDTETSHLVSQPRSREPIKRAVSTPQASSPEAERLGHCPLLRPGPALGCNFCWNTIDKHGRILRRKTKYYCPECQTNLCIVPCFQEYHEKYDKEATILKPTSPVVSQGSSGTSSAEPSTSSSYMLVTQVKSFAKTTSM